VRRREVVLGALGVAACGAPQVREGDWVEVPLSEVPALREVGGAAVVQRPASLLDVQVVRLRDRVSVIWRVCTHGACDVEYAGGDRVECPCHGSQFSLDGEVLRGPATRPLRRYEARLEGDTLLIRRG
jgi:cytochrome b6-f complex iron-sulfur subunit